MSFLFATSAVGSSITTNQDNVSESGISEQSGVHFVANSDLSGIRATISANTAGLETAYLETQDGDTALATKDISGKSSGDWFEINYDMTAGTGYLLVGDANGANYNRGKYNDDGSQFPYTSADFDIEDGVYTSAGAFAARNRYAFHKFEALL